METNVIMKRDLQGMLVRQNTKDQLFNANDLLEIYNKNNSSKRIDSFLQRDGTKETMEAILKELNIEDNSNTTKTCYLEKDILSTKRWRVNWWTRMHPYLFIDFAMWLSPEFKVKCIKRIYDNVISLRVWTWDTFKEVNKQLLLKWYALPTYYKDEANMINLLVFWSMEVWQRNTASEKQLDLLEKLQKADAKMIEQWISFSKRSEKLTELKEMLS